MATYVHQHVYQCFTKKRDTRHITLGKETGDLLATMISFIKEVDSEEPLSQIIKPKYILNQLTESSKYVVISYLCMYVRMYLAAHIIIM